MFQSLFFWNSPSDMPEMFTGEQLMALVSILVFLELAFGRYLAGVAASDSGGFQSLFFWNSPSD